MTVILGADAPEAVAPAGMWTVTVGPDRGRIVKTGSVSWEKYTGWAQVCEVPGAPPSFSRLSLVARARSAIHLLESGSTGAPAGIGTFHHESLVNARYASEESPDPEADLTR